MNQIPLRSIHPALLLLIGIALVGCNSSRKDEPVQAESSDADAADSAAKGNDAIPAVDPGAAADEAMKKIRALLAAGKLDDAQQGLEELNKNADIKPSEEQQAAAAKLADELAAGLEERTAAERVEKLASATKLMDQGKMAEALAELNFVQSHGPSETEEQQARKIEAEIARRRQVMNSLRTWMDLLGSSDRKEVRAAKAELTQEADSALPLLMQAVERGDNPTLVSNALELMRSLNKPKLTLPALVAVLERPKQEKFWPDAVRELSRVESAGAGEPLLKLALASKLPAQRAAALSALAEVVDPPVETLVSLLPLLADDGPGLAPALQAAYNAVRVHEQFDLVAMRGLESKLSDADEQALAALPERLSAIMAAGSGASDSASAAHAATVLAITTRQLTPQPLTGVKVLRAVAELPDGPASALVDGVWDSIDPKTMWRHSLGERSSVILDLGQERTVVGVRIWNLNEPAAMQRGWKETEVYVSNAPPAPSPIATGTVALAPGLAGMPDYSTLIQVPFARGRYVELQAKDFWKLEALTGLSEVQVLGF
jgi:hypothetical protein